MKQAIEFHILDYLRLGEQESVGSSNWLSADEATWKSGLGFTDTAGLSLHLRDRLIRRNDFERVPTLIQTELEQRHSDNVQRIQDMVQEFVEMNQQLQSSDIRYLNLKGLLLAPDFVEPLERRAQYDYDFLVKKEDLQKGYSLFLEHGYSSLHSTRELAADHLPPLIRKSGWKWNGNYFDPAIPRGVELHFQLWDSDFELISIQTLDKVWERSCSRAFSSIAVPTLCREDMLLYVTLHAFRHLLRNDLRLSHLHEIAFFLQRTSDEDRFWEDFTSCVAQCPNTTKLVATTFELARSLFRPALYPAVSQFIERHLPATAASWVRTYGRSGAIHCYRRNRNALLLHLGLLNDSAQRWALVWQRLLPRHLPLPTYGVQTPKEAQDLKFRLAKAARYVDLLCRRGLFQLRSLFELSFQLPVWLIQLQRQRRNRQPKTGRSI
jgi:putative nucleotidyltransferase-like protein